jgi:hypothetical protein
MIVPILKNFASTIPFRRNDFFTFPIGRQEVEALAARTFTTARLTRPTIPVDSVEGSFEGA